MSPKNTLPLTVSFPRGATLAYSIALASAAVRECQERMRRECRITIWKNCKGPRAKLVRVDENGAEYELWMEQ